MPESRMGRVIEFTKMHGAGNDYIYVDTDKYPIDNSEELAIKWSRFHTGIGSDGLILISRSKKADFRMRIFNSDGSEAMMCGNGSRCVGKFVYDKGLTEKKSVTLETLSGIKILNLHVENGKVESVSVDMGKSQILTLGGNTTPFVNQPITAKGITMNGTAVSMGNPHLVFFVENAEIFDVASVGSAFEHHPWFENRTNVEFAQILSPAKIRMRVWERGSGITMACGTGACATFAAAKECGLVNGKTTLVLDGGELQIENSSTNGDVIMTGPAQTVFEGKIEI